MRMCHNAVNDCILSNYALCSLYELITVPFSTPNAQVHVDAHMLEAWI